MSPFANWTQAQVDAYNAKHGATGPRSDFGVSDHPAVDQDAPTASQGAKRIRQRTKPLSNKLETAWGRVLRWRNYSAVYEQAITFKLANGVRYTPDFVTCCDCMVYAWEVKGHMRDDAAVKLKMAASVYPQLKWFLVWKEDGQWREQRVLP